MSTWHWAEDYEGRTCTVSTVSPGVRTGVRVICLVDATRPTPDAKKLVDETAQQSRKEINIDLIWVHLPTPLLSQRLGACEVFLLPPKDAEGGALAYCLHSKLISRPRIAPRDGPVRFKSAGILQRVQKALQGRRRSLAFLEEVLSACREQQVDMKEPRVLEATQLLKTLQDLRQDRRSTPIQWHGEKKMVVQLNEALLKAEQLQFYDPQVAAAESAWNRLSSDAKQALQRLDVQRMELALEGWIAEDWQPEDWDIGRAGGRGREIPRELETIQEQLEQKTDWKLRLSALKHLQGLVLGSHEVLRPVLPRCREALLNQVQDLRSALVREACVTIQLMASTFRHDFDFFALPALRVLLKSSSVTMLIIAESCHQCALAVVTHCRTVRVFQVLLEQLKVKNGSQRKNALELVLLALECYSTTSLERHIESLQEALRAALEDPQQPVREAARRCYVAFEAKFQERAQQFCSQLDAPRQRMLRKDAERAAGGCTAGESAPQKTREPSREPRAEPRAQRAHRLQWAQAMKSGNGEENVEGPNQDSSPDRSEPLAEPPLEEESPVEERAEILPAQEHSIAEVDQADKGEPKKSCPPQVPAEELLWEILQGSNSLEPFLARISAELLRLMRKPDLRPRALKLLEALAQHRLPALKGASLTELLQQLIRVCGAWPLLQAKPLNSGGSGAGLQRAALRTLRTLYRSENQVPAVPAVPAPVLPAEKEGQRALVMALNGLTSSCSQARSAALDALEELLQSFPQTTDFAEVLASKLFQRHTCAHQSLGQSEELRKIRRLLERLLSALEPLRAMEILLPLVAEPGASGSAALQLLPLSVRRLVARQALDHLVLILPALSNALSCDVAETRLSSADGELSVCHLEALRMALKDCEALKLRLPADEEASWRGALQILYARQVAFRRTSEPQLQQGKDREDRGLLAGGALYETFAIYRPEKRARKDTLRLPRGFAQRGDPSAGALRAALLRGAALWHEGLKRSQALQVPGLVVDQPIAADTVLLRIPKELHFSRPRCEEIFKNLYEACEALPSADPEKRAEAADALCFAKVLQSCAAEKCTSTAQRECQGPSTWPEAWGHVAATLLSNVEDFADHPYVAAWEGQRQNAAALLCRARADCCAGAVREDGLWVLAEHSDGDAQGVG
eukprot:g15929.t1